MAYKKDTTDLSGILFECLGSQDPMLHMLEWLCEQLTEAEVSRQLGAEKNEQSQDRKSYRSGYRTRRLDARKISSNNKIERLNKEIRRRTKVIGIFPNPDAYVRLVSIYLMEYSEDWSVSNAYLSELSIAAIPKLAA